MLRCKVKLKQARMGLAHVTATRTQINNLNEAVHSTFVCCALRLQHEEGLSVTTV
jgi:hypothetical protein